MEVVVKTRKKNPVNPNGNCDIILKMIFGIEGKRPYVRKQNR